MVKFKKTAKEISGVIDDIDYIENNLEISASRIIKELQKKNKLSRKLLDERFERVYVSKDGYEEKLSQYIKRRQNQENLLENSRIIDCEEKYDAQDLLEKAIIMDVINGHGFCDLHIDKYSDMDKYSESMKNIDYKRLLESTFKDEIFLYFDLGDKHIYDIKEIVSFNENYLQNNKSNEYEKISKMLKFQYFYKNSYLKINGIRYYMGNRMWIYNKLEKLNGYDKWLKLDENFSNYKTVLNNTKSFLGALKDINNGSKQCKDDDIVNDSRYNLKITCQEDIEYHYKKSIQEIQNKLSFDEWIVFNEILNAENGQSRNIKISDLYFIGEDMGICDSYTFYQDALLWLLIKGYVYMK